MHQLKGNRYNHQGQERQWSSRILVICNKLSIIMSSFPLLMGHTEEDGWPGVATEGQSPWQRVNVLTLHEVLETGLGYFKGQVYLFFSLGN